MQTQRRNKVRSNRTNWHAAARRSPPVVAPGVPECPCQNLVGRACVCSLGFESAAVKRPSFMSTVPISRCLSNGEHCFSRVPGAKKLKCHAYVNRRGRSVTNLSPSSRAFVYMRRQRGVGGSQSLILRQGCDHTSTPGRRRLRQQPQHVWDRSRREAG